MGARGAKDDRASSRADPGRSLPLALEAAGMVAWEWDLAAGRVACINACPAWGLDEGHAEDFLAVVHPDDRARVEAARDEAAAGPEGAEYLCEYRVLGPDGRVRWLESRGRVVGGTDGGAGGGGRRVVGISLDVTDRRLAEEAARQGELKYRSLFEDANDAIVLIDLETGRYVDWNGRAEKLTGRSRDELAAMRLGDMVPPDRAAETPARVRELIERGSLVLDHEIVARDGRRVPVELSARVLPLGGRTLMQAILRDVTAHRRADAALRRSEEQRRLAFEAAGLGLWDLDLAAGTGEFDDRFRELFGFAPGEEVTSKAVWARVHPEDVPRVRDALARAKDPGSDGSYEAEYRAILPDGTTRWHASKAQVHFAGEGEARRPVRTVGVVADATARRAAEDRLRLHALLLDSMAEGVSLATEEGVIVYTNPAEDRMFGYAPGELVGRHVTVQNAYPPEENARIVAEVIERLRTQGSWHGEWRNRRKDGTEFFTLAHITAVEVGGRRHWLCVQADVSERKRVEAALRESEERLDLAVRAHAIGVFDWHVPSGRVVWSEQEERLFGLEPGTFEGDISGWAARVLPEDLERMRAAMEGAMARREPVLDFAFRIRRADTGEVHHLEGSGRFLYAEDGAPQRMVGVNIDSTGRRRADERQRLLLAELSHRVKNTLAVVRGIAARSLSGGRTLEEAREVLASRLRALANAHTLLTASEWRGASLRAVLEAELRPHGERARLEGREDLMLAPKAAQTLALVLHELATNAAKHGALSGPGGRVEVGWGLVRPPGREPALRLSWRERDGPPVRAPLRRGFGSILIEQGLKHDLGGTAVVEFRTDGLTCELTIPAAALAGGN